MLLDISANLRFLPSTQKCCFQSLIMFLKLFLYTILLILSSAVLRISSSCWKFRQVDNLFYVQNISIDSFEYESKCGIIYQNYCDSTRA